MRVANETGALVCCMSNVTAQILVQAVEHSCGGRAMEVSIKSWRVKVAFENARCSHQCKLWLETRAIHPGCFWDFVNQVSLGELKSCHLLADAWPFDSCRCSVTLSSQLRMIKNTTCIWSFWHLSAPNERLKLMTWTGYSW